MQSRKLIPILLTVLLIFVAPAFLPQAGADGAGMFRDLIGRILGGAVEEPALAGRVQPVLDASTTGSASGSGSANGAVSRSADAGSAVQQAAERGDGAVRVPASQAEMQLSFAPVVKKVADSVVNVLAKQNARKFRSPFAGDPFFERFFGVPRQRGRSSLGSGVIVDSAGIVLTNNHVIENMDDVKIVLADGREFDCDIILKDKKSDLAALRIEQTDATFNAIEIGDSEAVEVGDLVLAIGNPFGVGQTVTSGIVSAVSRTLSGVNDYGFFIQTDAAINPGNSGGALVDMNGRLIGINTMIYSKSGGSVGIGYAVPSNMASVVLKSARTGDRVTRPWIGAKFQNVTSEIAETLGMSSPRGAMVVAVTQDSPAQKAGLKPGDIVLSVNGRPVDHSDALGYRLDTVGVGREAEFQILSHRERLTLKMALAAPPENIPRDIRNLPADTEMSGAVVANLSPAFAQEIGFSGDTEGVILLTVARDSPAAYNGMHSGDIIREVNGVSIANTRELERVVSRRFSVWRFLVDRSGKRIVLEREGMFFRQYLQ